MGCDGRDKIYSFAFIFFTAILTYIRYMQPHVTLVVVGLTDVNKLLLALENSSRCSIDKLIFVDAAVNASTYAIAQRVFHDVEVITGLDASRISGEYVIIADGSFEFIYYDFIETWVSILKSNERIFQLSFTGNETWFETENGWSYLDKVGLSYSTMIPLMNGGASNNYGTWVDTLTIMRVEILLKAMRKTKTTCIESKKKCGQYLISYENMRIGVIDIPFIHI